MSLVHRMPLKKAWSGAICPFVSSPLLLPAIGLLLTIPIYVLVALPFAVCALRASAIRSDEARPRHPVHRGGDKSRNLLPLSRTRRSVQLRANRIIE